MPLKVGDLVRNHNSESLMQGIIVGWSDHQKSDPRAERRDPVVLWSDGRCSSVSYTHLTLPTKA